MKFRYLIVLLPALAGCQTADSLIYEPAVTDPLDGYKGILPEAGANTEMDWGPKQDLLLTKYAALMEAKASLEKQFEDKVAENQNLTNQLAKESADLEKERALRAQAEAVAELLRQRRRDLEARILSLSIEKAKLEQSHLLGKIEELRQSLNQGEGTVEAAATPMRNR